MEQRATKPVPETLPANAGIGTAAPSYEQQLANNGVWALSEGSRHFDEKSSVFAALRKITRRLNELEVPYAVVGGMALFKHGLRRFTEDVGILVRKEDLSRTHQELTGLGYLPVHKTSKHLRDAEFGVRIEFLTSGDYPGDGKRKPVAFPDLAQVGEESAAISYINLAKLIELKLASGMTGAGRLKDLADVVELIKLLNLPKAFADSLDPYVRSKFDELHQQSARRFVTRWPVEQLTAASRESLQRDGVQIEVDQSSGEHVYLTTTDSEIAQKYEMVEESEFWTGE